MNCLIVDDEEMSRATIEHFVNQTEMLNLVAQCSNAIEAGNVLREEQIDLLFLDVEMPEMSGIDLIKSLTTPPQIILVTSKKGYAAEAFEYSVVDYLVKPVDYSRFLKAVNKVKERKKQQQVASSVEPKGKEIFIKTDNKIVKVNYADILFVEALADYAVINVKGNKYIIHSTMKGLDQKLPSKSFVRVHRSYIVNIERVESIEDMMVLINEKHIPVGASYKENFMKRLNML